VTNPDWRQLASTLDLTTPAPDHDLCSAPDRHCCRCVKKRACQDDGCKDAFNGEGVCVDVVTDDLSLVDTSMEGKPGLCKNKVNANCCSCFKKLGPAGGCDSAPCSFAGVQGVCVGEGEQPPADHVLTDGTCRGRGCSCWVPDTCRSPPPAPILPPAQGPRV
jgi:hypothetical protein